MLDTVWHPFSGRGDRIRMLDFPGEMRDRLKRER